MTVGQRQRRWGEGYSREEKRERWRVNGERISERENEGGIWEEVSG